MCKEKEALINACRFINDFFNGNAYDLAITAFINFITDLGIVEKSVAKYSVGYGEPIDDFPLADLLLNTRACSYTSRSLDMYDLAKIFDKCEWRHSIAEEGDAINILFKNLALIRLQPDPLIVQQISKVILDLAVGLEILAEEDAMFVMDGIKGDCSHRPYQIFPYNKCLTCFQALWSGIKEPQEA